MMSTLNVCVDCAMRGANGYEPDAVDYSNGHPQRYEAALVANDGAEPYPTGESEPHFSWTACHYCGDINGGDRIESQLVGGRK
jgi:hypothetical protein